MHIYSTDGPGDIAPSFAQPSATIDRTMRLFSANGGSAAMTEGNL